MSAPDATPARGDEKWAKVWMSSDPRILGMRKEPTPEDLSHFHQLGITIGECVAVPVEEYAALTAERDALAQRVAALEADAKRWRALFVDGGRVRVLGSSGMGNPDRRFRHIGVEFTNIYPHPIPHHEESRAEFTQYADEVIAISATTTPEAM